MRVEVGLEVLGHDVELVGDGEIDVAPGVAEQLGQLRLDRPQEQHLGADRAGTAPPPAPPPASSSPPPAAAAAPARAATGPARSAPGSRPGPRRPGRAAPAGGPAGRSRRGRACCAAPAAGPAARGRAARSSNGRTSLTDGSRYSSTGVPMVTMMAAASSRTAGSVVALMRPARTVSASRASASVLVKRHLARVDQGHALRRNVEQIDGVPLAGEGQGQRQADVAAAADDGQRADGQRVVGGRATGGHGVRSAVDASSVLGLSSPSPLGGGEERGPSPLLRAEKGRHSTPPFVTPDRTRRQPPRRGNPPTLR